MQFRNRITAFFSDALFREIAKPALASLIVRIAGVLIGFMFAILVSREISADMYGQYSVLLAWMLPLATLSGLGTDKLALKQIPQYSDEEDKGAAVHMYRQARNITVLISLMISSVLYILERVVDLGLDLPRIENFEILLLVIPVYALLVLNCFVLKAVNRQSLSVFLEAAFPNLITLLSVFILLYFFDNREYVFECYLVALLCSWLLSQYLVFGWKRTLSVSQEQDRASSSYLATIRNAYPMYVTSLITTLLVSVDVIMLSWFVTGAEVAVYAIAMRITGLVAFPLSGVIPVVAPKYSKAYANRDISMVRLLHLRATHMSIWAAVPIIALIILFPEYILNLFGSSFLSGVTVLYIVLIGQMMNLLVGPIGYLMWMCDLATVLQKVMIVVLVINIMLNCLLIPLMGIEGAAIATAVALFMKNAWSLWLVKKKLGFFGLFIPFLGRADDKVR